MVRLSTSPRSATLAGRHTDLRAQAHCRPPSRPGCAQAIETSGRLRPFPRSLREVRAFLAKDVTIQTTTKLDAPGILVVLTLAIVRLDTLGHRCRCMVQRVFRPLVALADPLILLL